jgi:tetratricopeptide (TPR) repeat protein
MRAFVFSDRALERQAGRFVWLSIDAEKPENAAFLEKFPVDGFPTLFVLDPAREAAAFRWMGSATVPQLELLLDDGERALSSSGSGPDALLAEADRLAAARNTEEATKLYDNLLSSAPAAWPPRDRAVESALAILASPEDCVRLATRELPQARTAHFANVAAAGLSCALDLDPPDADALDRFESAVRSALAEPPIELSADDRSSLYGLLVSARDGAKDDAGSKRIAEEWLAYLDGEAERAPTAQARAVFDPHRLSASIAAGDPAHAIPILEQSERDFPDDYNPPARLTIAYRETGRLDDALAAAERALARAYGPRKLRVYATKADVLEKQGDKAGAKTTLKAALRHARSLPQAQVSPTTVAGIKKRIRAL